MIFLMKFLRLCAKYWPVVLLVGLILYAGWTYHSMRMQIATMEAALFECAVEVEEVTNERDDVVNKINRQNEALMKLFDQNNRYALEIERLKMQRPEKITEYRDIIKEVHTEVVSPECVDAIAQVAKVLKEARGER